MTLNGSGIQDIVWVLGISVNTVLITLKRTSATSQAPVHISLYTKYVEIDEFLSFIHNKSQQRWLW